MVIEPRDRHIDGLTNDATPEASDHQQIVERSRARARLLLHSASTGPPPLPPTPLALSVSPQSFVMYVTRS